jgi:type II secretory pathway component GspD/PulD (secretin)/tetratricopeptide (TPR) repeat protein
MSIGNTTLGCRSVRSLLAAAGLAGGVFISSAVGQVVMPQTPETESTSAVADQLNKAVELLSAGKVVAAKSMLETMSRNAASMGDASRKQLFNLLANANRRVKAMNPIEVSLQTAEYSLGRGDLKTLEHHASAVIESPKATNAQAAVARDLLSQAAKAKAEFVPQVASVLDQAGADFEAGHVAAARVAIDRVSRSGVALTESQQRVVDTLQTRIVEIEQAVAPGMMQPGVIKPAEQPAKPAEPAATKPAEQPATKPAEPRKPEGPAATKPAEPAKAAQPAATKPAEPAKAAQPAATKPAEPAKAAQPAATKPAEPAKATQPAATKPAEPAKPAETTPAVDPIAQARLWESQSLMAEADQAFEQSRMKEAAEKYQRLLGNFAAQLSADQKKHAENRLAEAKVRMGVNVGPEGNVIENVIGQVALKRSQALAEFNNNVEQANKAMASGDPQTARNLAAAARVNVNSVKEVFSTTDIEAYNDQISKLEASIETRAAEIARATADAKTKAIEEDSRKAQIKASSDKATKINEGIDRVRALQKEMKYDEALQVCDQILFLDPINPTGLVLREVISDTKIYREALSLEQTKNRNIAIHRVENEGAVVPPITLMDYPTDWPGISYRRGEPMGMAETEENRSALALLEKKRVPVNFTDTPLSSVVSFLNAVTQLNFDVDWDKLAESGIDRETQVSLNLSNVPVRIVLERVLEKVSKDSSNGAWYAINDGVVMISSKVDINKKKSLQIYDIRDLLIEVPDYANAPEFDLQSVLQSSGGSGGGGGQSPFRDTGNQGPAQKRSLEDRTNELINIITTNVDEQGWQENGGDVGFIQQLQGSLIITNTPANHRAIHGLLSKLREIRAMQINVETRFLLVRTDYFEQIGFDLDVYFNGKNNQVRAARAAIPNGSVQPSDFFNFAQGGLQRRVFGAPTDANGDGTADPQVGVATQLPSPLSVVGAAQNSLGLTESGVSGGFAQGILSKAPAMGVGGQFMDDIQVDFLIKATQADRRTVTLTAPRLTFTNGQTSNIYVATQIAFVSDLQPVVSESAVGFDPTLATVNEGVRLLIEGTISADRRYVTMNVDASVAKIEGFQNTAVTALAGGGLINSASTQSFIQRPTTTVTRVQTTVTVPDQGTILLGGQRLVTEQEVESGVPVLSKIPIINRFFSNRIEVKEEQTLLILIKPTILIQTEEEERHFPGLAESMKMGG